MPSQILHDVKETTFASNDYTKVVNFVREHYAGLKHQRKQSLIDFSSNANPQYFVQQLMNKRTTYSRHVRVESIGG